jgi:hypothetical protein
VYEVHGWFALCDSTYQSDREHEATLAAELDSQVCQLDWGIDHTDLRVVNGSWVFTITSLTNHRSRRSAEIYQLVDWIAAHFPGAYGLLYERDDEPGLPAGTEAFTVRALARGRISVHNDPFLSPIQPTIED